MNLVFFKSDMKDQQTNSLPELIKQKAHQLGFDLCGIAKARPLEEYGPRLKAWVREGMNDKMEYLARDIEKRLDPGNLLKGARSMVITGLSYYSGNRQKHPDAPVLSRYAYGVNYHDVIFEKLGSFLPGSKVLNLRLKEDLSWIRHHYWKKPGQGKRGLDGRDGTRY